MTVPDGPQDEVRSGRPVGAVARLLDRMVGWYQVVTEGRISPCRYVPTCSTYAREALVRHGAARGSYYATRRLCRCHPWGGHGYDPVPGTDPSGATDSPSGASDSPAGATDSHARHPMSASARRTS